MKLVAYLLMAVFGLFGLIMILGSRQNPAPRITVGVLCLAAAAVMGYLARMRPATHTHVHKMELELSGDVSLENMKCRQCGAELSSKSVDMSAGAAFVKCEYCGAQYQLEEDAKW